MPNIETNNIKPKIPVKIPDMLISFVYVFPFSSGSTGFLTLDLKIIKVTIDDKNKTHEVINKNAHADNDFGLSKGITAVDCLFPIVCLSYKKKKIIPIYKNGR